jgi:hypothetical protein
LGGEVKASPPLSLVAALVNCRQRNQRFAQHWGLQPIVIALPALKR